MSGTSDIKAGRAFVEITAKDKISAGLDSANKKLKSFSAGVKAMGGKLLKIGLSMTAPLVAGVKLFTEIGDGLAKAGERTGVGVEALSGLAHAAEQSGSNLEELEAGFRGMAKTIEESRNASDKTITPLKKLGLALEDLQGKPPEEQFKILAERISRIADPSQRAALAMDIFGKSGARLLPMMKDGRAGIEELIAEAKKLGLVMTQTDAEAAVKLGDDLGNLWKSLKFGEAMIGAALAPALGLWLASAQRVISATVEFIKANRDLVVGFAALAGGIMAVGFALVTVGKLTDGVSFVMMLLKGAVGLVVGVFGLLSSAIALVMTPAGMIIGTIFSIVAAFTVLSGAGSKMIASLKDGFGKMAETVTSAFTGIKDALAAGDIKLAADILWTSLKILWRQGVMTLSNIWFDFKEGFLGVFDDMMAGVRGGWSETQRFLTKLMSLSGSFLSGTTVEDAMATIKSIDSDFDKADKKAAESDAKAKANRKAAHEADLAPDLAAIAALQAQRDKLNAEAARQRELAEIDAGTPKYPKPGKPDPIAIGGNMPTGTMRIRNRSILSR